MNILKKVLPVLLFISTFSVFFFPSLLYAQSTPWSFYNNPLQSNAMDIFYNGVGAANPALRIKTNGDIYMPKNVGIRTTNPAANLTIQQSSDGQGSGGLRSYNIAGTSSLSLFQGGDNNTYLGNFGAGGLYLYTNSFATQNMFLATSGNVGIGTTAPGAKLDVQTSSPGLSATIRGISSGAYPGVRGESTTASHVGVWGSSPGNAGVWGDSTTSTGVSGTSISGYGTTGTSTNAHGVYGNSTAANGVHGTSTNAIGVQGVSTYGVGVRGDGYNQPGVQGVSVGNAGIYGYSSNNWAGYFHSATAPGAVYMRSDSASAGSTVQIDRMTDAYLSGGSLLTLHNYGVRNDSSGFFFTASSDVNGNQGGSDLEFYIRGDGYVWADGAFTPGGADVAEWVPSKHAKELEPGDLVMVDGSDANSLTKKSDGTPYSSKLMGIVSTNPGILTASNEKEETHWGKDIMVTMSGRVPTKVSTENGEIKPGDHLTSSSTPGVAMKATKSGIVVGKALEGYYNKDGVGKIEVWVQSFWYGGDENQQHEIDQLKQELSELKKTVESLK